MDPIEDQRLLYTQRVTREGQCAPIFTQGEFETLVDHIQFEFSPAPLEVPQWNSQTVPKAVFIDLICSGVPHLGHNKLGGMSAHTSVFPARRLPHPGNVWQLRRQQPAKEQQTGKNEFHGKRPECAGWDQSPCLSSASRDKKSPQGDKQDREIGANRSLRQPLPHRRRPLPHGSVPPRMVHRPRRSGGGVSGWGGNKARDHLFVDRAGPFYGGAELFTT